MIAIIAQTTYIVRINRLINNRPLSIDELKCDKKSSNVFKDDETSGRKRKIL